MYRIIPLILLVFITSGCISGLQNLNGPAPEISSSYFGKASFYGRECQGSMTASGERFDMYKLTAAHRSLALGTRVRVINVDNGKSVVVKINDRGPRSKTRIIDLSYAAAQKIGMVNKGVVNVKLEVLE